jgi:hypothetical protein
MNNLVLPNCVAIQLVNTDKRPLKIADVLFRVRFFARQKSDFTLQPFASDANGVCRISRNEVEAEVAAHYDSGVMDYAHVSGCSPLVEICLLSGEDIHHAIEARKIWTNLLAGERDRWGSVEQLLDVYRKANNGRLFGDQSPSIRDDWDKVGAEYTYDFVVLPR